MQDFVARQVAARQKQRAQGTEEKEVGGGRNIDFLDRLLDQNAQDPEKVTAHHVDMMGKSNLIAGSDSTYSRFVLISVIFIPRAFSQHNVTIYHFLQKFIFHHAPHTWMARLTLKPGSNCHYA